MVKEAAVAKVAVAEDNGYGKNLNSKPWCGVSTVERRIMHVTIAGQNKLTRGKPELRPKSKGKTLVKEKPKVTARATAKARAKAMVKRVAREIPAKVHPLNKQRQMAQSPCQNPPKEKKDLAIVKRGGSLGCKRP